MKLRSYILAFLFLFAFTPLLAAFIINLPLVLDSFEDFYHKAHLQNLRADFRDLDQHLASRNEVIRLLSALPEPGTVLGQTTEDNTEQFAKARTQYASWINRMLYDKHDIVQLAFNNQKGQLRYALLRNPDSGVWEVAEQTTVPIQTITSLTQTGPRSPVVVSPITVRNEFITTNRGFYMTLNLISPIFHPGNTQELLGSIVMTIDVGGMARFYKDSTWVMHNGNYLFQKGEETRQGSLFDDKPGIHEQFEKRELTLWTNDIGDQTLWVPLLQTVDQEPIWVGRHVDPSPIADIQRQITMSVGIIMLVLVIIVLFLAMRFARRAEKLDQELNESIRNIVEDSRPIQLDWAGPQEIRDLSINLSKLSQIHASNTEKLINYSRELEQQVDERTTELQQAKRYVENIISHIGEALLVLDPKGKVKSSNPAARKMLGYTETEIQNLSIGDLFEEEGEEQATAFMGTWLEALIRTGVMEQIDARFKRQDGSMIPIRFTRTAIKNENDEITDILCIARDMTGFKRTNTDDE